MTQEAATMTAIVLPDIDRSTIEELKRRIPDLSEIELNLPSRKEVSRTAKGVSKTADDAIDRLLGRKRAPMWPWVATGIGLVALAAIVAAWFAWFRRPSWESQSDSWTASATEPTAVTEPTEPAMETTRRSRTGGTGTTSNMTTDSTSDAGSAPYPIEEA